MAIARAGQLEATRVARQEKVNAALERSKQLLLSLLTPNQQEQFLRDDFIIVRGSDGHDWRIDCSCISGNVTQLETDNRWCAHPDTNLGFDETGCVKILPRYDVFIAQMFEIQTDAEHFLSVANSYE
jgi:hypothetical protein